MNGIRACHMTSAHGAEDVRPGGKACERVGKDGGCVLDAQPEDEPAGVEHGVHGAEAVKLALKEGAGQRRGMGHGGPCAKGRRSLGPACAWQDSECAQIPPCVKAGQPSEKR